jgi:hypothetical protein
MEMVISVECYYVTQLTPNSTVAYLFSWCFITSFNFFLFLIYFSFDSCFSSFCMSIDVTDNAAFVVHAQLGPEEAGSLTYYVPVIVMDAEEDGE